MTISSSVSTVTRDGNGAATSFSFPFKVWDATQLAVFILNAAGEATETTNWTATLADPDPGGSVTYPAVGGTVLPTGWKIVINRNMPLTQEVDLVNATAFNPEVIEAALDSAIATIQQVFEEVGRSVRVDPGNTDAASYLTEVRAAVVSTAADAATATTQAGLATTNGAAQVALAAAQVVLAEAAEDAAVVAQGLAEDARDAAIAAVGGVKVSANDTTAAPLETKLLAGTGIILSTQNDGGDETRTVAVDTSALASRRRRNCNGSFLVDNINAGAEVTPAGSIHVVDNVRLGITQASKIKAQRVSASLTKFGYSERFTVVSTFTVGAADSFYARTGVEGLDFADMRWGTADAEPITVTFTAKVSVPGEYAFSVQGRGGRFYVFTETLSVGENIITKTIAGDTTGTWYIDNTAALWVNFDLGLGSNYIAASLDTWSGTTGYTYGGCVKLVENSAATYEISGIQVERGSFATPFEVLPYQQEEAWCQRYHPIFNSSSTTDYIANGGTVSTSAGNVLFPFVTPPRVPPTGIMITTVGGFTLASTAASSAATALAFSSANKRMGRLACTGTATPYTANQPCDVYANSATAQIRWTGAEL